MARTLTLVIGLGGTGTQVVRGLQKQFISDFGRIPKHVALGIVDAKVGDPDGGPIQGVSFTPNEHIDFPARFAEFKDSVDEWWPQQVPVSGMMDYSDGCGALRSNGRFYCFYFAERVEATVNQMVDSLAYLTMVNPGDGVQFNVILAGSLGNGTGGGTFMDVATIVRDRLAHHYNQPIVTGVFIPGSVTRTGWAGSPTVGLQVAASGYASLIELQYQFNRDAHDAGFQPDLPYRFKGLKGLSTFEYEAGLGQVAGRDVRQPPIDFALVLDRTNLNGRWRSYPDLIELGVEGISRLLGGADQHGRLQDVLLRCQGHGRRFGSIAAVRMTTPADLLLRYTASSQALSAIDAAADAKPGRWQKLLADSTPDDRSLAQGDLTVEASVDFFLDHVARIKETGAEGPAAHSDLVDYFAADETRLHDGFNAILRGFQANARPEAMVTLAASIRDYVTREVGDLTKKRVDALLEKSSSLWKRSPGVDNRAELGSLDDAGVKWLLDHRVTEFVSAGAFGLLAAWLAELKKQLETNRASVVEYERAQLGQDGKSFDMSKGVRALSQTADSIWVVFKKGALQRDVKTYAQRARAHFTFGVWAAKLDAIDRFYAEVQAYADELEDAARKAAKELRVHRVVRPLERQRDDAIRQLDDNLSQERRESGSGTEHFIGGDAVLRADLVAKVEAGDRSSSRGLLRAMRSDNHGVFATALGASRESFEGFGESVQASARWTDLLDAYREELTSTATGRSEPVVAADCNIETLLLKEADSVVNQYYEAVIVDRDAVDRSGQHAALQLIEERAGSRTVAAFQAFDWGNKERAQGEAIDAYVAGRLYNFIAFASPQWTVERSREVQNELHRINFLTYREGFTLVSRALQLVTGLRGHQEEVQAIANPTYDPRVLDIVCVQIGAGLTGLEVRQELAAYKFAVGKDPAGSNQSARMAKEFSPHTSVANEDVGARWLKLVGQRDDEVRRTRRPGPLLLGLGTWSLPDYPGLFGWVEGNPNGVYKVARDMRSTADDGTRLFGRDFLADFRVGPGNSRGIDRVVEWLDSNDDVAKMFSTALKHLLWRDLRTLALEGDGAGGKPLLWAGVAKAVANRAGDLDAEADKMDYKQKKAVLRSQAETLRYIAEELRKEPSVAPPELR